MTLKGIKTARNDLEEIRRWMPGNPLDPEVKVFLVSCSPSEIVQISNIFHNYKDLTGDALLAALTPDERGFLDALFARPILPAPLIKRGEPVCNICGKQPARERDNSLPLCDVCYHAQVG